MLLVYNCWIMSYFCRRSRGSFFGSRRFLDAINSLTWLAVRLRLRMSSTCMVRRVAASMELEWLELFPPVLPLSDPVFVESERVRPFWLEWFECPFGVPLLGMGVDGFGLVLILSFSPFWFRLDISVLPRPELERLLLLERGESWGTISRLFRWVEFDELVRSRSTTWTRSPLWVACCPLWWWIWTGGEACGSRLTRCRPSSIPSVEVELSDDGPLAPFCCVWERQWFINCKLITSRYNRIE